MEYSAPRFDTKVFWEENRQSQGKPFRTDKPRAPISVAVDDHWLIQEMELPTTLRYYLEPDYHAEMNRKCNDRCEEAIGLRPFGETPPTPAPLRIEEVMGSRKELVEGGTPWLEAGVSSIAELRAKLDEIERWSDGDLRDVVFSTGAVIRPRALRDDGTKAVVGAGSRGPATQATSILGTMNAMYWIVDYPADMDRFFGVLGDVIVRYLRLMESEYNVTYRGYGWLDDNCTLYSPGLYERFCFPVMKQVLDTFAPLPEDNRYQHSDSAMAHLLPILARLNFHGVNLGPTVPAALIRQHMPKTVVHGQVAPFTVKDKGLDDVVAEVKRDFEAVGRDGGLVVTTAGSISAGTSLESIRGFMWAVQEFCRYDG